MLMVMTMKGKADALVRRWLGKYSLQILVLFWIPIFTGMTLTRLAFAQFEQFNHPELKWQTIETEHYSVHFHEGAERTARILAGIAEEIYRPITELYDYKPDGKVHWIVRDHDDYSNGGTYYYDNKIVVWATPLDFELRGTHHWLYDVVTHEFTHLVQLGASRKGPRWLPGVYFQFIGYEDERRPDVLYGYPNRIGSWPVTGTVVPMWFAEGTAQFQTRGLGHDWWDTHRDMMIRVRALDGSLLTLNQMEVFGKNTLGSELVYCQGYALTRYIADKYGDDKLNALSAALRGAFTWDFDRACRKALGISERQLYENWRRDIAADYLQRTEQIRANTVTGKVIRDEGFANLSPVFSPDGKRIAFLSNKGKDYLSLSKVVIYDVEEDSLYDTKCPARSPVNWSPDGKYFVYARQKGPNRQGSHFEDLYLWDIDSEKEIRLTKDARLTAPAFSPDGRKLVAVHNRDGNQNLVLVELPKEYPPLIPPASGGGKKDLTKQTVWRPLTQFGDGRQIFRPQFSPDGRAIACATSDLSGRDIYRYDLLSQKWLPLLATESDERDAVFSPDSRWMYYASDRSGIYNLYRVFLDGGEPEALTNVLGGAFHPSLSSDGKMAYAEFTNKGYEVRLLSEIRRVETAKLEYPNTFAQERVALNTPPSLSNPTGSYANPFGKLAFLPRVAWDYGGFKPGFYAYTNDFLEKLSLFGGAQINRAGDRDLYLSAEYKVLRPTIFLEAYNITRHKREQFDDPLVIVGERIVNDVAVPIFGKYSVDYTFNLGEIDIGGRMPLSDAINASAIFRYSNYKSDMRFEDNSTFSYTYMRGRAYILRLDSEQRARSVGMDIHPQGGWRGWVELARENNRFIDGFEIDADKYTLLEVYKPYNYFRLETDLDYYYKFYKDLVLNPRLMAGGLSAAVDPFFDLYAGGLQGLRGYSFYSLGGTRKLVGRLALRFPLATGIDKRWGPFYLDRIHSALFVEGGDAWRGGFDRLTLKRDAGTELRVNLFSWYGFPTDLSIAAVYSLDRFSVVEDAIRQNYGREWRWYLTLLFDYF